MSIQSDKDMPRQLGIHLCCDLSVLLLWCVSTYKHFYEMVVLSLEVKSLSPSRDMRIEHTRLLPFACILGFDTFEERWRMLRERERKRWFLSFVTFSSWKGEMANACTPDMYVMVLWGVHTAERLREVSRAWRRRAGHAGFSCPYNRNVSS